MKIPKGWKEDKQIELWYPTQKWLREFKRSVNKLSKNLKSNERFYLR